VAVEGEERTQTRLCAPDQDEGDALAPGEGSKPIETPPASTPVPRPNESTTDLGLVRYPHQLMSAQRHLDADTARSHRTR
jgi:hypothetical protein